MLKTEFDWLKASKSKWHPRVEKFYNVSNVAGKKKNGLGVLRDILI